MKRNNQPALILVDIQKAFEDHKWGKRNNLMAEENIKQLLNLWRTKDMPVVHIQHYSDNPTSPFHPSNKTFEIKDIVKPADSEPVFTKKVNSAFIGTDLESYLRKSDIISVVITGLTTPHCISTTTRMSGNLGFKTTLLSDATASFELRDINGKLLDAETVHQVSLATLNEEFAKIMTTDELLCKIREEEIR
ncbi:cysteine hydrolase family protein [Fictibacillus enclensis]|uniref:cysteine hydrolase family protein n=1 Tax=Fictibacillus enclensis TaxID=1017270 RepID=UPI0025A0C987|nr:cysteine hydrolase family protein [Fictibacillus enclensis]MDM5336582.1 cysteine hydrolase family protein [Fictibacillus enclensis]